ncbi:MAG: hypothetical protein WCD42_13195 [Rhizomicrobium sp.]
MIWIVLPVLALALCLWLLLPLWRNKDYAAYVIAAMLFGGAGALYFALGSPGIQGAPYEARWHDPSFAEQTGDAAMAEGDMVGAEDAYRRALVAATEAGVGSDAWQASLYARVGEAIVLAHDGTVTGPAGEAFADALRRNPHEPRARFFGGLALMQHGQPQAAMAVWRDLAKDSPPDAPWMKLLREKLPRAPQR